MFNVIFYLLLNLRHAIRINAVNYITGAPVAPNSQPQNQSVPNKNNYEYNAEEDGGGK